MEHFVTLFDSLFLPQGLALQASMERHVNRYTLWILCVDDIAYDVLFKLHLPNIRLLKLSELETPDLLRVKYSRAKAEYCWTLTPFAPRFVFEAEPSVKRVTYLDADIWFRNNPKSIFDELDESGKEVLITDHSYSPEYDQSDTSGKFCVQFIIFSRNGSEVIRKNWEQQCIDWCYARFENGKFGDQKYLDNWPKQYDSIVHILNNKELALAPWNATRFPYGNAVFYHFHGLRILSKKRLKIGHYIIPAYLKKYVYEPYYTDLRVAIEKLESIQFNWQIQATRDGFVRKIFMKIYYIFLAFKSAIPSNEEKW